MTRTMEERPISPHAIRTRLILSLLVAFPAGAVFLSHAVASPAEAAKKATPTPKKASTHKAKKKHKKPTPTPTPKPRHRKTRPKPTSTPKLTATATPKPTSGPSYSTGDFTGPTVTTRWGPVTVTITVQNHRISDVHVATAPDTARSQFINSRAIPVLVQETLQAQNAQIDLVSGATQLSQGYVRSLQGAVQKASA